MQNDPQPTAAAKARQIPRKRERLRAFVALTQEKVVWIGIFLLIASWMMPPWVERRDGEFYGFHCALSHPYHDRESIDFGRLALIDLTILTLAAGAAWQLRKRT